VLQTIRVDNDPVAPSLELAKAGPDPEVVLEATYGWYRAADLLKACGARVHLAHPLGVKTFGYQRARDRRPRLEKPRRAAAHAPASQRPGWPPPAVRELRELVRYRAKLVALRSGPKAQVHAVLATQGVRVPMSEVFGVAGTRLPRPAPPWTRRRAADRLAAEPPGRLRPGGHDARAGGRRRVGAARSATPPSRPPRGVGAGAGGASSWPRSATSTASPAHRSRAPGQDPPPTTTNPTPPCPGGPITKQGPRLVRWAAVEATGRLPGGSKQAACFHRIADRRGTGITPRRRRPQAADPGRRRPARRPGALPGPGTKAGFVNGSGAARHGCSTGFAVRRSGALSATVRCQRCPWCTCSARSTLSTLARRAICYNGCANTAACRHGRIRRPSRSTSPGAKPPATRPSTIT
jgi:hypothetical protein